MNSLLTYWSFDYITVVFIGLLCLFYLYALYGRLKKRSAYFFAGIFLLIFCVASPLHFLGENYLFSAHMLSHTLILLVAAPLLVLGIPPENRFKNSFISISKKVSKSPLAGWLTGVCIMWFWHIPTIFNRLTMMNDMSMNSSQIMSLLSYIHILSLLLAGMIFCLPIINPYTEFRLMPLKGVLYLTSACVLCSILGLLITFAPAVVYTHYLQFNNASGFSSLIRNDWGISKEVDQQIGGLIMWVPCCFIYLSASMSLLIRWFDSKKEYPVHH
jgi:cytochrome c oxidase assembly factor CtaG